MNSELEKAHILLVEDEESLAVGLEYNLQAEGYDVTIAKDGKEAVALFKSKTFDLIILDIMLPYLDGFELAGIIRKTDPQMPILMLTAKSKNDDKIMGLEAGADDYMTKPFNLKELLLRVQGMLKRKKWYGENIKEESTFAFGNNFINFESLQCTSGSKSFQLTPIEAMVMKYLIQRKNKTVSRRALLQDVWNINPEIETRTVDNFIVRLRRYFEPDPSNPQYIMSIRGAGYIFVCE